jgi:hypothetical protein
MTSAWSYFFNNRFYGCPFWLDFVVIIWKCIFMLCVTTYFWILKVNPNILFIVVYTCFLNYQFVTLTSPHKLHIFLHTIQWTCFLWPAIQCALCNCVALLAYHLVNGRLLAQNHVTNNNIDLRTFFFFEFQILMNINCFVCVKQMWYFGVIWRCL